MVSIAGFWYIWQAYLVGGLIISFYHQCDHHIILFSLINIFSLIPIPHQEWLCAHHDSSRHCQQCRRFRKVAKIINQKASFFIFAGLRIKVQINYWKLFWWYRNCKKLVNRINIPRKCTLWIFLLSRPVLRIGSLVDSMRSRGGGRGIVVEGSLVGRKWYW